MKEFKILPDEIQVPVDAFSNPNLTGNELKLLAFIHMMDDEEGCQASNGYLACLLNVTEVTISTGIRKLISEKYVIKTKFNGRIRTLKINPEDTENKKKSREGIWAIMEEYKNE